MDAGETIRFRVTAETFHETCPTGPMITGVPESIEGKVPYSLTVRFLFIVALFLQFYIVLLAGQH